MESIFYFSDLTTFIAFDIETTGLSPETSDIIELAAVKIHNGKIIDEFQTLINPSHRIPEEITRLTGITNEDVRNAPIIEEKLPDLFEFFENFPILGHSIDFDISFIDYNVRKINDDLADYEKDRRNNYKYIENILLDSVFMSRIAFPDLPSHKLTELTKHFEFSHTDAHRALDDAKASFYIFTKALEEIVRGPQEGLRSLIKLLQPTNNSMKFIFSNLMNAKMQGHFEDENLMLGNSISQNYNIIGKRAKSSEKDEFSLISEQEIQDFFEENGKLSKKVKNYEARDEQKYLSLSIANTFNESNFLISEAGTGTGKSFAYLYPSILWAYRNKGNNSRVILSTQTKNLQEQLFYKDLPLLSSVVDENFQAVLLKGKGNYLCLDKWHYFVENSSDSQLSNWDRTALAPLAFWKVFTNTGDISENGAFHVEQNFGSWKKMTAENNYCSGKKCAFYDECYIMKARNTAREADIVVINHSLLFSTLGLENNILGDFKNLIIDEAHNIERVATEYLRSQISLQSIRNINHGLYHKKGKKYKTLPKLLVGLSENGSKLPDHSADLLLDSIEDLILQSEKLDKLAEEFFSELSKLIHHQADPNKKFQNFRYQEQSFFQTITDPTHHLSRHFTKMLDNFSNISAFLNELESDIFENQLQVFQLFESAYSEIFSISENFNSMINAGRDDFVYWIDPPSSNEKIDAKMNMAPLKIDQLLHDLLYDKLETGILTSATLAVDKNFDHFKKRVGISLLDEARISEYTAGSPFDYQKNVNIKVANFLYEPNNPMYLQNLSDLIIDVAEKRQKGILILFTSYSNLKEVYRMCKSRAEKIGRNLVAQRQDGNRHYLINLMKEEPGTILLGADSFWEGVDLPGEALETLIITKLPFAVPSNPIIEAKTELIQKEGKNAFMEFSVPDAVIKFRQGFGRLIRTASDKGEVIITDTRVCKKRYGRIFLDALPKRENIIYEQSKI
jgi:predicted DnaQ family exonuclease/DinG family helicase